ncbi:hypothetical protein CEXT_661131 [Caerostris extrusa]|uniref:Uncharacterized protein n=1 Tax=Caerostris extrusa TaxID=172846 RepID=A0AAV4NFF1_CAEEX|nr:hypothetical protein CEXT_661131 [Caerostris extrusa]
MHIVYLPISTQIQASVLHANHPVYLIAARSKCSTNKQPPNVLGNVLKHLCSDTIPEGSAICNDRTQVRSVSTRTRLHENPSGCTIAPRINRDYAKHPPGGRMGDKKFALFFFSCTSTVQTGATHAAACANEQSKEEFVSLVCVGLAWMHPARVAEYRWIVICRLQSRRKGGEGKERLCSVSAKEDGELLADRRSLTPGLIHGAGSLESTGFK